jgi:hypothetical protein
MALKSLAAKFGIKIRPQYSRAQPCASKNSRFWTDPEGTRESPPPPKKNLKKLKVILANGCKKMVFFQFLMFTLFFRANYIDLFIEFGLLRNPGVIFVKLLICES